MKRLAFILALLLPAAALAWPVDVYVELKPGQEKFQKAAGVQWVELRDPAIATAEPLPGDEVLLTGLREGETLALLYGGKRMGVWKLRTAPASGGAPLSRPEACPGVQVNPGSATDKLVVFIRTEACRKALLALFKTDALHSREVTLTFDIPVLQAQLREVQAGIDAAVGPKKVEAAYAGGTLRLKGRVTAAEHRQVLWAVFDGSVGRVTLDDQLIITDATAPDAGAGKDAP